MRRREVFVDTWDWVAWAVSDDDAHTRAAALQHDLQESHAHLLTSNFVLSEALTRLRYDYGLTAALTLVETVDDLVAVGDAAVIVVDEGLWASALDWFRRYADQRFSFVDCTSFAIMHARQLTEAVTADRHFATAGFTPLGLN